MQSSRREFLAFSAALLASLPGRGQAWQEQREFKLSLSQQSLQRRLADGKLDHLDFAEVARSEFGLEAIDYASRFFKDRAGDEGYLSMMNKRAADQGVRQVLLVVDSEQKLAHADAAQRKESVQNHRRWIEAAVALGCRAVCVQPEGDGPPKEQAPRLVEALSQLAEYGSEHKINLLVSNRGGPASDPAWLIGVLEKVDSPRCAAMPLFGEFGNHNQYEGMAKLMKVAKGVCATARDFNGEGNETQTDYVRMMEIVLEAGYRGYVSLEYQGETLDEYAGIHATMALLERIRTGNS